MKTGAIAGAMLAFSIAAASTAGADEFAPLCADLETGHRHCWNPVEVAGHEGCHFYGHVSYFDHVPPMRWSGACRNGRAEGHGVLLDKDGSRAEGRLVEGLKDGSWTATLANGGVITERHVEGVFHGPWTFDLQNGRFYSLAYEDGRMQGPWERRDDDGYSMAGSVADGSKHGIWTLTWPDGVAALVPYEKGVIRGEMTVTRDGMPLGTLLYWKGKHVDGVLDPVLIDKPLDP